MPVNHKTTAMRLITVIITLMLCMTAVRAQRTVTPVENDDKKPPQPTLHYYDKHGKQLKEPVLFLAQLDTVKAAKAGPKYPLLYSVDFGVNFFDAVMLATGTRYANFDVSAQLSLHNWFFPTVEVGVGYADDRPDDRNFRYRVKPTPYFKVGMDYNFLYKSDPAYRVFLGLRAGLSSFRYDVLDVTVNSGYWGESSRFDITGQRALAVYGQLLAGVKVKIAGNFSLGWTARYNFNLHRSHGSDSNVWFVPGYGAGSHVSATFSAIYTLPLAGRRASARAEAEAAGASGADALPVRGDGRPEGQSPSEGSAD